MSEAADKLIRLSGMRVFIPPHTRTSPSGGIVNVKGYWKVIQSARDLSDDEMRAVSSYDSGERPNALDRMIQSVSTNVKEIKKPGALTETERRVVSRGGNLQAERREQSELRRATWANGMSKATGPDGPQNVSFGKRYGNSKFDTPEGRVWMYRKGQKVRFFDESGKQVGPEHQNVAPAIVSARMAGWQDATGPNADVRAADRERFEEAVARQRAEKPYYEAQARLPGETSYQRSATGQTPSAADRALARAERGIPSPRVISQGVTEPPLQGPEERRMVERGGGSGKFQVVHTYTDKFGNTITSTRRFTSQGNADLAAKRMKEKNGGVTQVKPDLTPEIQMPLRESYLEGLPKTAVAAVAKAMAKERKKKAKLSGGDGDEVKLTRVWIPPHKRSSESGVVNVKGYWREVSSTKDLTRTERRALGVRDPWLEGPTTPAAQQRTDAAALVDRITGRKRAPAGSEFGEGPFSRITTSGGPRGRGAEVRAERSNKGIDTVNFNSSKRGGSRLEVRRVGKNRGEVWRITPRTGDEPADLLNNPGVKVTDNTIETQEAIGSDFDELVARTERRWLEEKGYDVDWEQVAAGRARTVGKMGGIQTKERGTAVIKRNLRRLGRKGR